MNAFKRNFPIELLTDAVLEENAWLCDLLRLWRPAGSPVGREASKEDTHLRLAIRGGTLNFYRAGQSVAQVRVAHRTPAATIHHKYIYGPEVTGQRYLKLTSAGYAGFEAGGLMPYDGVARLREWITHASRHAKPEKCFVDRVVAYNADVIDLEVGLPAVAPGERSAPRMDFAALERDGDAYRVVFWEAKLARNQEARRSGEEVPKVVAQLQAYTAWLTHLGHAALVIEEYKRTCRLLVAFHAIAARFRPDIEPLGDGILAVGRDGADLSIDKRPRLLIGDLDRNAAFTGNKHLQKLLDGQVHVHMVQEVGEMDLRASW